MKKEEVVNILRETESLLEGHFLLSSGLHSDRYVQCAKVFQYPEKAEMLCKGLKEKILSADFHVDKVVSPAIGGILIGYELSRQLGVLNLFAERDGDGKMSLRRGFRIEKGDRVLVAEDVVTTGGSVKEVISLVKSLGGVVSGVSSIVNRSKEENPFDVPFFYLLKLDLKVFSPESCPLCERGIKLVKPGSKKVDI